MSTIHKFELNERKIILDVHSGSVHVVDDLVWDIINEFENSDKENIISKLSNKYKKNDIIEALNEIDILIDNDMLFSKDKYINEFEYNKDNIVKAMCLHIAHDCNLKCEYCFASQGDFNGDKLMMSEEVGKKALDFLVQNSGNRRNLEVDFFGGEPLMNFDVVKSLVYYGKELEKKHNKNFRFTITTNGLLLNDDNMSFINKHMSNVVLSLDGRKEVNDEMRKTITGEGSFDIILPKFIKLVKLREDKNYYVRGTFTSKNLDFSKDVIDMFKSGFSSISVEPVVSKPEHEYSLKEEHLETILSEYEKLSKEYIDINKDESKFNFFHFTIDLNQGPCMIKRVVGCGAGVEYLAVTPEGDLYPCHQFVGDEEFKMGTVHDGIENNKLREKFKNANVYSKDDCKDCWAKFYCSGGCHANAYNFNNDINKPYTIGCEMEKKRIECAISISANLNQEV